MRRAVWLVLLGASLAWAHGFHVEAVLQDGELRVEGYFSDGEAPGAGTVVVRLGEAQVAAGQLDGRGTWRWTPSGPGLYRVEVTEPGLHKAFAEVEVPAPAGGAREVAAVRSSLAPTPEADLGTRRERGGGGTWWRVGVGLAVIAACALALKTAQAADPEARP